MKRRQLSKRKVRELASEAASIGYSGPPIKAAEEAVLRRGLLYLVGGRALLVRRGEVLVPHLSVVDQYFKLPSVVVDMGAVPHIVNGADVMAPGVVKVEGEFAEGDIVAVRDERHWKALAIGIALTPSSVFSSMEKGKAVKNVHYVGDEFWEAAKELCTA